MTERPLLPSSQTETEAPGAAAKAQMHARPPWIRPHTPLGWVLEALLILALAAMLLLLFVRIAPLTSEMRLFIQARADGLSIGPLGVLHVEGLEGDVWRNFTLRRLTIADQKGVWLEADNLRVRWRYTELLSRRLHVREIDAGRLAVLRQPIPKPAAPGGPAPAFSYRIDEIRTRLELDPAFSGTRGLYDVEAGLDMPYGRGTLAHLNGTSVLRPGDHLRVNLNLGRGKAILIDADALETRGGGIAGALGLMSGQTFALNAHISGTLDNGKLDLVARSGSQVPVQASGSWTPLGGSVNARINLDASRWTAPLVTRFGPQAQLVVTGKQRQGSVYDMDARFIAANLVLMGRGPFDMAKQSSPGLGLSVVVNDLKKLTPAPQMGAGRATGVLSGSLADLRFTGDAQAQDIDLLGWRLAKAGGPVKVGWKKGELDVQGDLAGSGGTGSGVIALAGGPTPRAVAEVARLKDGRILIRSLDATGRGVRIQAEGGQNPLFKGLSFKGQMQTASLGEVLPGAKGELDASWSASQDAGPDQPWVFTAEGRGQRLATGTPEIDRLMGPDPRLTLAASLHDGAFTVSQAALEGAKESASAKGRWALAGDLDFGLDWQAEGPFGFGPLEIDGKAKGAGKITGTLGAPKAELTAGFDSIALPQMTLKAAQLDLTFAPAKDGSDGTVALTGQSAYGPARARSAFRFQPSGIELSAIDADAGGIKAKGALALLDGAPSSADLTLAIGPGALLTEGQAVGALKIQTGPGGAAARADLDLSAKGAVLRGQPLALATAHIKAGGPLDRLPYQVTADGAWLRTPVKVDGSGVLAKDPKGYALDFSGTGTLRRAPFKTLEPAQLRLDDGNQAARLRLSLGGGLAQLDARQTASAMDLDAKLSGVDLTFLSEDFTGRFDADVALAGQGQDLHGTLDAALKDAHSRDARKGLNIDGQIKAALAQNQLTIDARLGSAQGLASSLQVVLPADAAAAPFRLDLARARPMRGTFQADGEIQPLWDLFFGGERTLGGRLAAKADIGGTPADPKVVGHVDLMNGLFDDYATGLKLRDVQLGAALESDAVSLDHFQANDGQKGQVSGQGQVSLARGGGGNLTLNLTGFRLLDNDTAQADASGKVSVTRAADGKARIAGALDIVKGEVNAAARTGPNIVTMEVVEKNRPFRIEEQVAPPPPTAGDTGVVALDLTLKAKRGVLIKGRGLNVDMALDAQVTGTTAKPVLSGQAQVVRGDYDLAGKRFTFDSSGTVSLSTDPSAIRLDLTATWDQQSSLTAVIRIQGTAQKPLISLSSIPILPQDEVLSQVLFGSSAAQLSPFEAAQLASALTALASGGGFDVVGGLRSFARLDRLALISGNAATGVSVAGGKYLGENVYLEVAGGGRTGPSAEVEYRVTRNLSLVSRLNNQIPTQTGGVIQGGTELSVRWRHEFRAKAKPAPAPAKTPG